MSSSPFKAGGALTDEHDLVYVERQADLDALSHLRRMDYLLLIEPRQQGKTSLINRLMRHSGLVHVVVAYADMTTLDRAMESSWYRTLCHRILRQFRDFIPRDSWPSLPEKSIAWRDFLSDVALLAKDGNRRVVIALDEIGATTVSWATEFFSVLRDVYNSRQAEPEFKHLTFLLAGAFHPRDLIQDTKISPFNIAIRVRLSDFSLAEVRTLVSQADCLAERAAALAEHIHFWTDGQPYLTQLLCSYLGPNATPPDVDAGLERLLREDENHLPPILERLASDDRLSAYVDRILKGERIKFVPSQNRRQAQLELLGVLKADSTGYCTIRNRLYEQILCHQDSLTRQPIQGEPRAAVSISQTRAGPTPELTALSPVPESKSITWLHLSDFHFTEENAYDENVILAELRKDLVKLIVERSLQPDLVVVTGDIAFSGKANEYRVACEFLDELLATVGLGKDRLLVVPGNHDVDRRLITQGAHGIGDSLQDRDSVNAVLGNPGDRGLMLNRFKAYAAFIAGYFERNLTFDYQEYFCVRTLDLAGKRIALLGLNSAWLCGSDEDRAKGLLIGSRQVRTALKQAEGADLKVALLHHPFDWLREFDQNDSATMLLDNCDFVLHGHLHKAALAQLISPDSGAMLIAGGACYKTRDFPNLYNVVRLDFRTGTGTVCLRRYSEERGGFWTGDVMTYRNVDDGMYTFPLPPNLHTMAVP